MKRFAISSIILILIITASFSVPCYLKKTTIQLINKIDEIQTQVTNNDLDSASSKTREFIYLWSDKKDIITIFVDHDNMNDITYSSAKLPFLLKYKNISEFCAELNNIRSMVFSVYDDDMPSLSNIV